MRAWLKFHGYLLAWLLVAGLSSALEPVTTIAESSFCPAHFIDRKTGKPNLMDLRYAVEWIKAKDLDPLNFIDQVYVVGGRVHAMAEMQRTLATRAGYDLEVVEATEDHATVKIRKAGVTSRTFGWRTVTVTIAQATKAKWTERNPNYQTMPERMLIARACTQAISLYAPEASRLIGLEEGGLSPTTEQAPSIDTHSIVDGRHDELHTVRRDEPLVPPERRDDLRRQIDAMAPADVERLNQLKVAHNMPNVYGPGFTLRDAALLQRWIWDLNPERPFDEEGDDDEPV